MILPVTVLLFAGLLLYSGFQNHSVTDSFRTLLGRAPKGALTPKSAFQGPNNLGNGAGKIQQTNFGPATNPVPGAVGSRLDQGLDGTGRNFLSPWDGTVVKADPNDPGWAGGGYVAIQSDHDPSNVWYEAEGLIPTVSQGMHVTAGQRVAIPATNPYNGIVGNFEVGLADPKNPGRPLAQVVSDPATMVRTVADWIKSLGGPTPTSTSDAGHT